MGIDDSDRVAEINLKRLIKNCEKMGAQAGGVLEKDNKRTFMKYLSAAQKQCNELESSSSIARENLDEYNRKINFLLDLVNPSKMAMPINTGPTVNRIVSAAITHEEKSSEVHTRSRARRHVENTMRAALLSKSTEEDDSVLSRDELLQQNRNQQQNITEGMASMAERLKDTSYKISNVLKDGNKKVGELMDLTDNNVEAIATEAQRVKEHSDSTSLSTLSLCAMLVFVMMVFIGTYMMMKMFPKVKY